MDPNPKSFSILYYVMQRLPSISPKAPATAPPPVAAFDVEQPPPPRSPFDPSSSSSPSSSPSGQTHLLSVMPNLKVPVIASRREDDVNGCRSTSAAAGE
ncbi:unnamed protein product [Linum trigynum]|uniref:Uncharacterized protein n=1 Tax=Linum trigynum TaxID=586398 RepID=A0AAV2FBE7_9ROSI